MATVSIDLRQLAETIRRRRESLRWSTEELAQKSGISTARINQIENCSISDLTNKVRVPRPNTITRIAEALSLPVTTLLRMAGHNATEAALDPRQQLWHEMQRSYELLPPTDQTEINIMLDVLAREIQRRQSLNKNNPLPARERAL